MMVSTPLTRAAERVREACVARMVYARPKPFKPACGHHVPRAVAAENRAMVRELRRQGLTVTMTAEIVGISRTAVQRHIRAIKQEAR